MALPYYVEPEYWEEAYAEGDAKLISGVAFSSAASDVTAVAVTQSGALISVQASAASTVHRIFIVGVGENYYVAEGYWEEGYALTTTGQSVSSAAVNRIFLSAANISTQSAAESAAGRVRPTSASVTVDSAVSAQINRIFLNGAAVSATLAATSTANLVFSVDAQASASASVAALPFVTANAASLIETNTTVSSRFTATFVSASDILPSFNVFATANRVQFTSASAAISAIFSANARLKWEPKPDTPETWTDVPAASGIWTDVPDTSEIWTEVS